MQADIAPDRPTEGRTSRRTDKLTTLRLYPWSGWNRIEKKKGDGRKMTQMQSKIEDFFCSLKIRKPFKISSHEISQRDFVEIHLH